MDSDEPLIKERSEETIIKLEDNQSALVIDDEGNIQFYLYGDLDTEEGYEVLKPHELIILAFSLMYANNIEKVVETCREWLEECDSEWLEEHGIVEMQVKN